MEQWTLASVGSRGGSGSQWLLDLWLVLLGRIVVVKVVSIVVLL